MRILHVIGKLDSGGAERCVIELANGFSAQKAQLFIACEPGRMAELLSPETTLLTIANTRYDLPWTQRIRARRLRDFIRANRIDLLHLHSKNHIFSAREATKQTGIPLVSSFHGSHHMRNPVLRWGLSQMMKGQCLIAHSAFMRRMIKRSLLQDACRVALIPWGVDCRYFDPARFTATQIDATKRRFGFSSDPETLNILMPARFTPSKGHLWLLQTLAALQADSVPFRCVMAGSLRKDSRYFRSVLESRRKLNLSESCKINNHCTDMPGLYAASDIALSPSIKPESFGLVALEAAAMQKPFIGCAHGGACETVLEGTTGFLVAPGDVDALALRIKQLRQIRLAQHIGQRARLFVINRYRSETVIKRMHTLYQHVLKEFPRH